MSVQGLGRVKTCGEKYSFRSFALEAEEHTELQDLDIRETDSLPFAGFRVFTQPGSKAEVRAANREVRFASGTDIVSGACQVRTVINADGW